MKPRNAFVHFFVFIILSWFSFKQKIQCFEWNYLRMPNNIALLSLKQPLSVKFALPFYLRTLSIYSAHDKTIKIVYLTSVFAYVHKISLFCPTSAFKNHFFKYLFVQLTPWVTFFFKFIKYKTEEISYSVYNYTFRATEQNENLNLW